MPVSYRIHPHLGLVHVRYSGFVRLADSFDIIDRYMRDPDFAPGQKQLVDLSAVTGHEQDYARLLELQARKLDAFRTGPQSLVVYYAPSEPALTLARLIVRSWKDLGFLVPLIHDDEAEALALLGIAAPSLDALAARGG